MNVSRLLGTSAATAVLVLAPTAAFAADGYGGVAPNEGSQGGGQVAPGSGSVGAGGAAPDSGVLGSGGGLPSTGSTALDTAVGGAGLALVLGGGAMIVASRRRTAQTA